VALAPVVIVALWPVRSGQRGEALFGAMVAGPLLGPALVGLARRLARAARRRFAPA
jgi:hypothetical protein